VVNTGAANTVDLASCMKKRKKRKEEKKMKNRADWRSHVAQQRPGRVQLRCAGSFSVSLCR